MQAEAHVAPRSHDRGEFVSGLDVAQDADHFRHVIGAPAARLQRQLDRFGAAPMGLELGGDHRRHLFGDGAGPIQLQRVPADDRG